MKKLFIFILLLFPICVNALELPKLNSTNFLIYDLTDNKTLHEVNANEKRNVASLTKIITTIVALEKIDDLDQKIVVTSEMLKGIPWDASVAGFKVGDEISFRDALYGTLLPSGADAAHVLAFVSSGSVAKHVEAMNDLAKKVGANDTNFINVTGYDEYLRHYSTANDILKLLKYALENEKFKEIYCAKKYTMTNGEELRSTVQGYNEKYGFDISRIIGSKTGFTDEAGTCISILTSSNGHDFIIITLNAPWERNKAHHFEDAVSLIDFMDKNYGEQKLLEIGQDIKQIDIKLSNIDTYTIKGQEDITKYLPIDFDRSLISIKYDGKDLLSFNDGVNDEIGSLSIYYNDELVGESKVVLDTEISISYRKVLKEYQTYFIAGAILIVVLILLIVILIIKKKHRSK